MSSIFTASDLAAFEALGWVDGTYTPPSGSASTKAARVDKGAGTLTSEAGEIVQEADELTFWASDLDPPAQGATWTNGTTSWTLGDVTYRDDDEVRVRARRT